MEVLLTATRIIVRMQSVYSCLIGIAHTLSLSFSLPAFNQRQLAWLAAAALKRPK